MPNIDLDFVIMGMLWFISFIGQVSVHEAAHAWMAWRCGDGTAKYQGRLTLDPGAHIDPVGTILMPLIMIFMQVPLIGWAKPVPVYPYYLRHPVRDMMYVALAGPVSNVILAIGFLILFKIYYMAYPIVAMEAINAFARIGPLVPPGTDFFSALPNIFGFFLFVSIIVNVILAVFNMLPIPPLDGSRILAYFLDARGQDFLYRIEPYGFIIILGLIWLDVLDQFYFGPIFDAVYQIIFGVIFGM